MVSVHKSVLLHETIESLISAPSNVSKEFPWYVDGTLGGAGHTLAIAVALRGKINIIGIDQDPEAIHRAEETLKGRAEKLILECENFRNIDKILAKHKIDKVDMILLDLGISSDELQNSGRGFSFQKDEPLLMTMGDSAESCKADPVEYPFTARDILNDWKEDDIANVIFAYGEEGYARRIARAVVNYRLKKKIESTSELAEIVRQAVPPAYRHRKINPATKTFQALRIAVNDELKALEEGLNKSYEHLNKNGRLGVIAFHSLEDRIVKNFMRREEANGAKLIPRRAVKPTDTEITENPRARSAKLRVIEKQ
ncbi:MAG: 16S rRNA (cytosine(1402)-N(4))-methyltransferase RsmH [Candidatus Taylorbacteria bacterium]|nr:16S rRNA (cytosine(1402)-N(4))-methyltransferase RsmH [Candidatus Taylorbacteria bacterium]